MASMIPSGTSRPSASWIAGVVIRWPTLRTSISARDRTGTAEPSGARNSTSGLSRRTDLRPPFSISATRSPFIRPSQLR